MSSNLSDARRAAIVARIRAAALYVRRAEHERAFDEHERAWFRKPLS